MYKHLEGQAAAEDLGETDLAAEEEALLHGGHQDYPQQLVHAVDNLHESSVISICCWPGDSSRAVTGSGKFVRYTMSATTIMQGRSTESSVQEVLAVLQAVCLLSRPVIDLQHASNIACCRQRSHPVAGLCKR